MFDWVKIGNVVKYDANVHNDQQAEATYGKGATDVTQNGQSFTYLGSNDATVTLHPDGKWNYTGLQAINPSEPFHGLGIGTGWNQFADVLVGVAYLMVPGGEAAIGAKAVAKLLRLAKLQPD